VVFVGAVVTGTHFVELARLNFYVGVVLSGSPVGLSFAVFVGAVVTGTNIVELARLNFCVGVFLSGLPGGRS
jgi:hypothetical protein